MTRRREILFRSIAIAGGIAIGSAGLEVTLRLIHYDTRSLDGEDPIHQAIFGDARINAQGFRDGTTDPATLQKEGALVAIGDSFTFGSGIAIVADRYTDLLSAALGIPVLNLGRPGADFPWHATAGDHAIKLIRPAGIILQFTMNDVKEYSRDTSCENPAIWSLPETWKALAPHSYLLIAVNRANAAFLSSLGGLPSYEDWLVCIHRDPQRPGYRKFVHDLGETIERWNRQVDFVVLLIWPWYTEKHPYPFGHVHEEITAEAQRAGAEVLDLREQTRLIPVNQLRLNDHDAHPNEYANALAAKALADHLIGRGLLVRRGSTADWRPSFSYFPPWNSEVGE